MEKTKEDNQLNAVLEEYSTLRSEILFWLGHENKILIGLPSVIVTLLGYAFVYEKWFVLLILPLITLVGILFWLSDHCMVRILSLYISKKIEGEKIKELVGRTIKDELWIGWDTFVQNLPKQLTDRGVNKICVIIIFSLLSIILSFYGSYMILFSMGNDICLNISSCVLILINFIYIIFYILLAIRIRLLTKDDYYKEYYKDQMEKKSNLLTI